MSFLKWCHHFDIMWVDQIYFLFKKKRAKLYQKQHLFLLRSIKTIYLSLLDVESLYNITFKCFKTNDNHGKSIRLSYFLLLDHNWHLESTFTGRTY